MPNKHGEIVEGLTKDAESGKSISESLNQIPFQERLNLAREIEKTNAKHRQADSSLPELKIETENDTSTTEHLSKITSNGNKVYDLPKAVKGGVAEWVGDLVIDSKMERDTQDSKHLESLGNLEKTGKFYTGSGSRSSGK